MISGPNITTGTDTEGRSYYQGNATLYSQRFYFEGIEYEFPVGGDIHMTQFPMSEGRITCSGSTYAYEYQMKDHLGNVRASFICDASGPVMQQEDYYYPFGLSFRMQDAASANRYLYNGKEKEDFHNLGWNDYGARFYDPQLGRWHAVDQMDINHASYSYANDDPMNLIDNGGCSPPTWTDEEGNVLAIYNDNDYNVYMAPGCTSKADIDNFRANGNKPYVMGETWTILGFADFEKFEQSGVVVPMRGAKIDFLSCWATSKAQEILDSNPSIIEYAINARGGHVWDIKTKTPDLNPGYGSLLYGKYASGRDAGNFVAGAFAIQSGSPDFVNYGYGLYNASKNNIWGAACLFFRNVMIQPVADNYDAIYNYYKCYGEDALSKAGQNAGSNWRKNLK